MKKRRELDALVTNGKLPRRKSKSGHELLRSNDSDSSEVEEFSVPIGNKAGKKWIGICPCSSCVALLVFIVMTSCLIACGGLIWMHFELKRDLDNLRERLLTVENRNQGAPEEFQKYHTQIQDLNRTLHNIQTGDKGMDKIAKNLTDIAKQLKSLNKATSDLKEDLQQAPYLKSLPKKLEALTSTVVKMGSDIQIAEGKVDSLEEVKKSVAEDLKVLKKKVADMENKTQSPSSSQAGREHASSHTSESGNTEILEKLQMLTLDIDKLNKSVIAKFGSLNSTLILHETRLSLLENFTSQQASTAGSSVTEDKTSNALKQLLNGDSSSDVPSDNDISALTSLVDKVDNITVMVASLGQQYIKLRMDVSRINKSVSSTGHMEGMEDFALFQTESLANFEYLNSTVLKLNENLDKVFKLYIKNRNELTNATAHITAILRLLSAATNGTGTVTSPPVTTGASSITPSPAETTTANETVTKAPLVKIGAVHNMKDLELNFNRWDRNGVGQVDPDDLQDYMRDPPSREQLKPFDADHNGKYSLEEFAEALGFKQDATKEEMADLFQ